MKSSGIQYNVKLQRMVSAIKRDIDASIVPLIKQYAPEYTQDAVYVTDGWADAIDAALTVLANRWATAPAITAIASEFVRTAFGAADRKAMRSTGIDVFGSSREMDEYLRAATIQNVKLIGSIPERYLGQVGNIVYSNMRMGNRPGAIVDALHEQYGVEKRKAKFIARDQAAKVAGEVTKKRQIAAGFEYFQWIDSHDERVRHRHREIANARTEYGIGVYRWDDLPISDKGEPIQPGSDYNCRCGSKPVSNKQVERNMAAGQTSK